MERWNCGLIERMSKKLLQTHNLKKNGTIEENGVVANILESLDNKRKFIFTARSYMYFPKGDIISGMNKKVVDESVKKNWTLLFGFEKEGMIYELNSSIIAKYYKDKTKEQHNQILYDDVSFKNIGALNWNPARRRSMNKPETFITNLFKKHNLPIIYTGDGRFPVSSLEPDWVCVGNNKLIDFFGVYYHKEEDENNRRKIFEKEGYDYLVIWEGEEKDSDKLLIKVKNFIGDLK